MSKSKQPPQVCISMPTYDLMQVSTCLSLIKLMDKFTMAKIRATVQTFKSPYVGYTLDEKGAEQMGMKRVSDEESKARAEQSKKTVGETKKKVDKALKNRGH